MSAPEAVLRFVKMSGGGNDFLVIEAADAPAPEEIAPWVSRLCRRGLSVGGDGVLLLGPSATADARLTHYNADGTRSALCGNGSRCAARWVGLQRGTDRRVTLETDAGLLEADFPAPGRVCLRLPFRCGRPELRRVSLGADESVVGHFVEVGIPHFLVRVSGIDEAPVETAGPPLRNHEEFRPHGTNVSFVAPRRDGSLDLRTYERGVEGETLACGTACVAAALLAAQQGWSRTPVICHTRSGVDLTVEFVDADDGYADLRLAGDARVVYRGEVTGEALAWGGA